MKLYLSSYRIPDIDSLSSLAEKQIEDISLALIPNAKDYYAFRAKKYKVKDVLSYQSDKGLRRSAVVDLLDYRNADDLLEELSQFDVIWCIGGNTFCLRQEMKRSGFDEIVRKLLDTGVVYGGDSAGAVAIGTSLRGIESADIPEFAEEVIYDGIGLVDKVILPHADNAYFAEANQATRDAHDQDDIIELKDNEALIVNGSKQKIIASIEAEI